MAGRILNRRELRKQSDAADQTAPPAEDGAPDAEVAEAAEAAAAPVKKARAKKAPADPKAPKVPKVAKGRKPRAKKAPPRMCARWGVFDGSMKQVAVFDYNQRAAADEKLADLQSKKKGGHFLQIVKEAMAEPVPAESTSVE